MSLFTRTFSATLYGGGGTNLPLPVQVVDASVTLDEGWAPYAQASIVIKQPSLDVMARLSNLAARPRIVLSMTSTLALSGASPTVREFDLGIMARQVFVKDGTVGLSLASDEAVLQDFAHTGLTADTSMRIAQSSVRNMVQYVMGRALTTTTIVEFNDFDFTTYYRTTNLWPFLPIPSNDRYMPGGNATVRAEGSLRFRVIPTDEVNNNDSYGEISVQMTPGKTYTISGTVQPEAVMGGTLHERARRIAVVVVQSGVPRILALTPVTPNTTAARTVRMTVTIPENSTAVTVRLYSGAAGATFTKVSGVVRYSNLLILEGNGLTPDGYPESYFDGNTASDAGYTYAWDGEAGLSPSTRTPRLNRSPEILTWKPGQTAWDFLSPILEAAGLRFWCDEARRWHLTTSTYSVPGTVQAHSGSNLYAATDLMSRTATQSDGVPLFVDAVILRYTWIDDLGNSRERYDAATTAGSTKPLLLERPETPFPGAGAATYLLRRYMLRRRQVPVTAALDLKATPGMGVSIRTGDGTTLTGYLDAVTFDMGADEMPLKTKNLT